jgi:2-methylfumaryl-CoA hydratase
MRRGGARTTAFGHHRRMSETWGLDGPYFDDLRVGQILERAPSITIGAGEAAQYQAICGDPYALSLSTPLAASVTGEPGAVVNPALVLHVAIGQSTVATRRVIANLFYRDVLVRRGVRVGETLTTTVDIRGMRETGRKPDKPRRGMALLGIRTTSDRGDVVAAFERCALLPFRDAGSKLDARDDLQGPIGAPDLASFVAHVPTGWSLAALGEPIAWTVGETRVDPLRDTVTGATALVRLTQNLAAAHRDASLGQGGKRLVYGGHTIGLAQASLHRLLPNCATVIGWHSCDHTGPVFEDDVLAVRATLDDTHALRNGRLLSFRVIVDAIRGTDEVATATAVLDWHPVLFAP